MDLKNEVAGITAVVGFPSLVGLLAGVTTLVRAAAGAGGAFGILAGATATALGLAGLLAVWATIESGYFDPEPSTETMSTDAGSGPDATASDATTESETDVEPA